MRIVIEMQEGESIYSSGSWRLENCKERRSEDAVGGELIYDHGLNVFFVMFADCFTCYKWS